MGRTQRLLPLALALALFSAAPAPEAAGTRLPGKIVWSMRVYQQVGRSHYDLWVANADGTGKRRLTHDGVDASSPKWSPNGSQIAYLRPDGLWLIGANGRGKRRLASAPAGAKDADVPVNGGLGRFEWSPRGDRIAFMRYYYEDDTPPKVFWVTFGGGRERLAGAGDILGWRADGRRLVWSTERDGRPDATYETDTTTGTRTANATPPGDDGLGPRRSPDGRWLAKLLPKDPRNPSRAELRVWPATGSGASRTVGVSVPSTDEGWLMGWLWDNRRVLIGVHWGSTEGNAYEVVDTRNGWARPVLSEYGADGVRAAAWSPGFRYVLVATCDAYWTHFGSLHVYHNSLRMLSVEDGKSVRRYSEGTSLSRDPDWYVPTGGPSAR